VRLFNKQSLFELTLDRNSKVCDKFITIANKEHRFFLQDQIESFDKNKKYKFKYLFEPVGRNTAPAIALACLASEEDEVVLVTPSDHIIKNLKNYEKSVKSAVKYAEKGFMVTFGVTPAYPETGYGYIESCQNELDIDEVEIKALDVNSFKEKPNLKLAEKYLDENSNLKSKNKPLKYFWNSGMFCFKTSTYLEELKKYTPEIYETSLNAYKNAKKNNNEIIINSDDMALIPEDSIDYAVMEKSENVVVIPSDMAWDDLGSFDALYGNLEKNEDGNVFLDIEVNSPKPVLIDSNNNMFLTSKRLIAGVDLEDLIIVDSRDALLIARKNSGQKIKEIVKRIQENSETRHLTKIHVKTSRPWGSFTVLEDKPGYKIKKIVVKPGKRLSLQKHYHRSEHWIVVTGTALVTVGNEKKIIRPNESTYIKIGEIHRLENPGKINLVMVEVQVGEYTGEDDIVRLKDDFDRIEDKD
jgi:mannose-1-phosphate guanylyltransferase